MVPLAEAKGGGEGGAEEGWAGEMNPLTFFSIWSKMPAVEETIVNVPSF